ncbi:MAG: hypothetical protein R3C71_03235 [Candidatus Krumholzibacteriia bacterium]
MGRRPVAVALVAFGLLMAACVALGLARTGGGWAYALDDAYIHLALGRTLAEGGGWGLVPGQFDGVSSSPLWTLLVALARPRPGAATLWPFALNLLFGGLLLAAADLFLARRGLAAGERLRALLLLVLLTPLPALAIGGMEHLLQAWLALLWLGVALPRLGTGAPPGAGLLALSALLCAARPEGAFLVVPGAVLFARRGRRAGALGLLAAGAAPWALYAALSLSAGGGWLPDSLLLKGRGFDLRSPAASLRSLLLPLWAELRNPLSPFALHLMLFIVAGALVWHRRERLALDAERRAGVALLLAALALQLVFGGVGWFFRYESWLVALGLAMAFTLPGAPGSWRGRPRGALALVGLLLLVALGARSAVSLRRIPLAMGNVAGQQLQVARYLEGHHAGETVVLDDIGAPSFYARVRAVDPLGLATPALARARREGRLGAALAAETARRGARVALLHPGLFEGEIPAAWVPLLEWTIPDNVVCSRPTVAVYACTPADGAALRAELADFAASLPPDLVAKAMLDAHSR